MDRAAFEAFGIPVPEEDVRTLEVWPENELTVLCFIAMSTQWVRSVMTGRLDGLRYEALPIVMRHCGIRKKDRSAVFFGMRTMERAAVELSNG